MDVILLLLKIGEVTFPFCSYSCWLLNEMVLALWVPGTPPSPHHPAMPLPALSWPQSFSVSRRVIFLPAQDLWAAWRALIPEEKKKQLLGIHPWSSTCPWYSFLSSPPVAWSSFLLSSPSAVPSLTSTLILKSLRKGCRILETCRDHGRNKPCTEYNIKVQGVCVAKCWREGEGFC